MVQAMWASSVSAGVYGGDLNYDSPFFSSEDRTKALGLSDANNNVAALVFCSGALGTSLRAAQSTLLN